MEVPELYPMVKRLLWIAFVWNDHNFCDAERIPDLVRSELKEMGIKNFDDANAFLDRLFVGIAPLKSVE